MASPGPLATKMAAIHLEAFKTEELEGMTSELMGYCWGTRRAKKRDGASERLSRMLLPAWGREINTSKDSN